eukprot:gene24872-31261_t
MKASAPIATWETVFDTEFFTWEDTMTRKRITRSRSSNQNTTNSAADYIRATEYSIPIELQPYITAVFNTVQVPPVITNNYKVQKGGFEPTQFQTTMRSQELVSSLQAGENTAKKTPSTVERNNIQSSFAGHATVDGIRVQSDTIPVTVSMLNNLYSIPSNTGNSTQSQTVVQMSNSYFSPDDLLLFQQTFDLPQQAAVSDGNYLDGVRQDRTSTQCNVDYCIEGNLDLQYISGVAQDTVSIFWYADSSEGDDPFLLW